MSTSPINDPVYHLGAMVEQLVRQNQTLISFIERVVTSTHDLAKDTRVGFRNVNQNVEAVRSEVEAVRAEMNERFRAVGARFDDVEEHISRVEDGVKQLQIDLLRMENGVLNAQQAALQAHIRLDDRPEPGEDPAA